MLKNLRRRNAQTTIEYMLLLGVVVALVLVAFKVYLPMLQNTGNIYFNTTARAILGKPNPCGDGYCCSRPGQEFENVEKCPQDCDNVGGDIAGCPP